VEGLGAVYRRRDGRWEGQIRIRGGPRRSFYGRTRREAVHKLKAARWTLGQGLPVSSGAQPLATYFTYWLTANRARLRPVTLTTYTLDIRRLTTYLGNVPLRAITPGMIQSTYAAMLRTGLSQRLTRWSFPNGFRLIVAAGWLRTSHCVMARSQRCFLVRRLRSAANVPPAVSSYERSQRLIER